MARSPYGNVLPLGSSADSVGLNFGLSKRGDHCYNWAVTTNTWISCLQSLQFFGDIYYIYIAYLHISKSIWAAPPKSKTTSPQLTTSPVRWVSQTMVSALALLGSKITSSPDSDATAWADKRQGGICWWFKRSTTLGWQFFSIIYGKHPRWLLRW